MRQNSSCFKISFLRMFIYLNWKGYWTLKLPTLFRQNQIKHSYSCSLTYKNPSMVTYAIYTNTKGFTVFKTQIFTFCHYRDSSTPLSSTVHLHHLQNICNKSMFLFLSHIFNLYYTDIMLVNT